MSLKPRFSAHQVSPIRNGIAALITLSLVALAGCGGGDDGDSESSADPPASSSAPAESAENEAALAYTGGTEGAADDSLEPVVIGFVTQDGGIPGFPETIPGAEAAVDYVNNELGGIGGHPLELRTCLIVSSEEEGQKCGQQMANDPDVRAVLTGQMIVGNASLYETIGDSKPVLGTPTVPADYDVDNNFNLLGAGFTGLPAMAIYAATTLKAEKVAMVYADEPGGQAAAALVEQFMNDYGVELTKVPVPTTTTDVIGAITATDAASADVFLAVFTAPLCIQTAKAMDQLKLDVPVVSTVLCMDQAVSEALGDIPPWTFGVDSESPFLPEASPEVATYVSKLRQYAGDDANIAGFAPNTFAKVLTLAKVINDLGVEGATPAAVTRAVRSFTGPMWMGGPKVKCGVIPDMRSICNTGARVYSYDGDGGWSDATDGAWIDIANPPAA